MLHVTLDVFLWYVAVVETGLLVLLAAFIKIDFKMLHVTPDVFLWYVAVVVTELLVLLAAFI